MADRSWPFGSACGLRREFWLTVFMVLAPLAADAAPAYTVPFGSSRAGFPIDPDNPVDA